MKVCLYLEGEDWVSTSGFRTAFENHRRALESAGVGITLEPKDDYQLLHTHFFGPKTMFYILQAKRKNIPSVCHAHSFGAHDFRDSFTLSNAVAPLYDRYLKYLYNQSDMVMTCSQYAKSVMEAGGITVPIEVVSNGMDTEGFRPDPAAIARFKKQIGVTQFAFFTAGNLIPRKGVIHFIEVAKRLPQYDFVWFGKRWNKICNANPDMAKALEEAPPNVKLPGFVDDTASAFAAMDGLFFPSFTENQPMTILESATLGLPLVVRDIPEYQGFLTHGSNSLKAQNVEDFVHHLTRVAEDGPFRERLCQEARALTQVHNLKHVGQRLNSLYASLMQQRTLVAAT